MRNEHAIATLSPMMKRLFFLVALVACSTLSASAQRLTAFSVGHTNILDTYLSQEKFSGTELGFLSQGVSMRDSSHVSRELTHHASMALAGTRGNDHSLLSALYNFRFGWHYNWFFPAQRVRLRVGGVGDLTVGGVYNSRNSNNPAQARLAFSLDPSACLSWDINLGHQLFTLSYAAAIPFIGLAFSPNYGQSYYEIFSRGNYDHNLVFISPFSGPQLHQMLTFDMHICRTTLTVGYIGDILQMKANDLKYHQYSHGILIGWKY